MSDERPPTIAISMSRKINMGNYESAECFVSISGVTEDMTAEQLEPLMETGKVAWELVRARLTEQVRDMRKPPDDEEIAF